MIDNFRAVFSGISLSGIMSQHVAPDIVNVFVMGAVWLIFALYLYYYVDDSRISILIVAGLVICSVIGNEILRPILFHFRFTLEQTGIRIYLPEIANHRFPSGYFMMSASSIFLIWYSDRSLGRYALIIGVFISVIHMHTVFSYTVDFFAGILIGLIVGRLLVVFYEKKEEEEEEYEELEGKFHF